MKALFAALRDDLHQALPKIAEQHARLVESAVEKGSRNLADHAANEAQIAEDFRARMPRDEPRRSPLSSSAVGTAAPKSPSDGTRIKQALGHDDVPPAPDLAAPPSLSTPPELSTPRFGSAALRDAPNFDDEIDRALAGTGLSRAEYDGLRLTPTHELTIHQIQQVAQVRNAIGIQDDQIVTKVVDREVADGYLSNDHELFGGNFDPTTFGNSIARGTDIADLTTPAQLRDGLSLDDRGQGWTPVAEDAEEAYQLRFPAPKGLGDSAEPSYGAVGDAEADPLLQDRADAVARIATGRRGARGSVMEDPFTGTGYTAAGVPEWLLPRGTPLPRRAEMWKMTRDGRETMVGYYNQGVWTRVDDPPTGDPSTGVPPAHDPPTDDLPTDDQLTGAPGTDDPPTDGATVDDVAGADDVRVDDVDG